ncbi:TetR/AcrR family transcriptional regulator [Pseudogemmobacter faecipullorum]|uniref:TetR/AcrR family transcriptional regulator n=1 Tax=Pseudogemmobacter faecipullorum TaxID=2755041 RepID=A0ABS8CLS6_9RHOB|nr:TetR/AcrR family transcriptional regulator [Pseudogemmobacter faecipullorum]MCB5410337.1 TetR/AcrR family transcriptional regulator [Pseudogemmobacter faecipullorum]
MPATSSTTRTDPKPAAAEAEREARLTRADWLALALETLVSDGIDQVKIQIMAKQLNVARSSFYWHFESREALLDAMLQEWLQKNTGPIIERALRPAADINLALITVSECWLHRSLFDHTLDVAVRLWARRSDEVRRVVLQADTMRTDAIRAMFMRYGYEETDALIRARTIYFTQIGQFTLEDIEPPPLRRKHAIDYIRIFTGVSLNEAHLRAISAIFG